MGNGSTEKKTGWAIKRAPSLLKKAKKQKNLKDTVLSIYHCVVPDVIVRMSVVTRLMYRLDIIFAEIAVISLNLLR
jgi:hypothetical protein